MKWNKTNKKMPPLFQSIAAWYDGDSKWYNMHYDCGTGENFKWRYYGGVGTNKDPKYWMEIEEPIKGNIKK